MKFRVSMNIEAESIYAAADELAAILTRAEADERIVSNIVTHGLTSRVLHFAEGHES